MDYNYCFKDGHKKHLTWKMRTISGGAVLHLCSRLLWIKSRSYILMNALTPCCPRYCSQTLFIDWTHLLISSGCLHLLSPFFSFHPTDIFLLPFSSIRLRIPSAALLSSCITWRDPVSFLHPLLFIPTPAWAIALMTSSSHVYNENTNLVSLQLAHCWIALE